MTTCPACNAQNAKRESFLGALGLVEHHRCRYCGVQYSHVRKAKPLFKSVPKCKLS